jgi:hypothetical protein
MQSIRACYMQVLHILQEKRENLEQVDFNPEMEGGGRGDESLHGSFPINSKLNQKGFPAKRSWHTHKFIYLDSFSFCLISFLWPFCLHHKLSYRFIHSNFMNGLHTAPQSLPSVTIHEDFMEGISPRVLFWRFFGGHACAFTRIFTHRTSLRFT